jgi:hypothetical protein
MAIHSREDISRRNPRIIAITAANKWIRELCSSLIRVRNPLKAYEKLRSLFFIEKFSSFIFPAFYD